MTVTPTQNVATHHTLDNDDEAAQQPGWNFVHMRSPHFSHNMNFKHAIVKNPHCQGFYSEKKPSHVPQNCQKRVPKLALRERLAVKKLRERVS